MSRGQLMTAANLCREAVVITGATDLNLKLKMFDRILGWTSF